MYADEATSRARMEVDAVGSLCARQAPSCHKCALCYCLPKIRQPERVYDKQQLSQRDCLRVVVLGLADVHAT